MTWPGTGVLKRLLVVFFSLFIFTSTFSIALSQMSFGLALVIFIVIAARERYQPFVGSLKWFYLAIAGYLGWLLLATVVGVHSLPSLDAIREEWLFSVTVVGTYLLRSHDFRRRAVRILAAGVALISVYGVIQYVTHVSWLHWGHFWFAPEPSECPTGVFANEMTFGNYFAVAAFFILGYVAAGERRWDRERWLLLMAALLSVVAAFLSSRRGPLVAMVAGLAFLAIARAGKARAFALGGLIVLVVLVVAMPGMRNRYVDDMSRDISGVNEGGRLFVWKNSLAIIAQHPIFGVGPANFTEFYAVQCGQQVGDQFHFTHAHNDVLNVAAVSGIPNAILFCTLWAAVFSYCWAGYRRDDFSADDRRQCFAALLGSLVFFLTSFTEATFADEEVRQLLMFVWAFGLVPWYKSSKAGGNRIATQSA